MTDRRPSSFDFGPMAAGYERWYETAAGKAHDHAQRAAVLTLLPRPQPGDRLLDVGCGSGHWSRFFADQGYEVFGLDVSPPMLEVARSQRHPGCHFEIGDACRLPAGARAYRVVTAMATLEFVSDPAAAVAGMVRNVLPGGTILVGTLNRLAPLNRERLARGDAPYASARLLSAAELRALLWPYGPVRLASAEAWSGGSGPGLLARLRERLRLRLGHSTASFLVAALRPVV